MDSLLKKWRLRRIANLADRTPESVESDIKGLVLDQVNREPGISWAHTIPKPKNMEAYVDKLTAVEIKKVYSILFKAN